MLIKKKEKKKKGMCKWKFNYSVLNLLNLCIQTTNICIRFHGSFLNFHHIGSTSSCNNPEHKGLFRFAVSITHNSKMMGPMAEKSVWILFLVFVSITQFFYFFSYELWVFSVSNGIFVIKLTTLSLFSRNVWLLGFFFFFFFFFLNKK